MKSDPSAPTAWCILRMSGPRTLAVTSALADADFDVWTPVQVDNKRVGPKRKPVQVTVPLLPTFVFARHDRLGELVAFTRSPAQTFMVWDKETRRMVTKGCPHFSVMRHDGRYISVSDRSLDALRVAERRGKPLEKVRLFEPGEQVKCPDGAFEGLTGVVETTKKRYAVVVFPGWAIPVDIEHASLLSALI